MLEVKELRKIYASSGSKAHGEIAAVNNVSFNLDDGVSYALIGESGSGKSTLSKLLMGLIVPTSGEIILDGRSITPRKKDCKTLFSQMQLIMQDGKSALDPHFTVYRSIAEPIRNLLHLNRDQEKKLVFDLMERMELDRDLLTRKPSELSGGQQKRVCIARAISVSPRILIFDEAVTGLDVIVRKNILHLLKELQNERQCTYFFITHDIDAALYIADHIYVMKNGQIVEKAEYNSDLCVFKHPYTKLLLTSILP